MTTLNVIDAERDFKGTLRRVTTGHEVIVLKRGKRDVAVMLPMSVMEDLEDLEDIREADRILAEIRAGRQKTIPLEKLTVKRAS